MNVGSKFAMFRYVCFTICLFISADIDGSRAFVFTICLFISPDLDGNRGTSFTICLFISPDLDGNRGTRKTKMCPEGQVCSRYVHDMFV
jgi:hypothetical protein